MSDKKFWQDLLVSLAIANLWFLKLWLKMLPYHAGSDFLLPYSPFNSYLAAMLNTLFWGGVLCALLRFSKRRASLFPWLVLAVFSFTALTAAYGIGASFISVARFVFLYGAASAPFLKVACWIAALVSITFLVRCRRGLARHYAVLPLLFAPYLLVTFGESLAALPRIEPAANFRPHAHDPAAPLKNRLPARVVWVIFDETDYRLGFEKRPASLALPEFDRLRQQALFATEAYSPNDNTQTSLPSLLTGIPLERTDGAGAGRLDLVHAGGPPQTSDFAAADTVFHAVKARGGSTALFGWYLPYGRTLPYLDRCRDYPRYNFFTSDSLPEVFFRQWLETVDLRFLPFSDTLLGENQIGIVTGMETDVARAVRDDDPSLMFLHYSVPHSPNIYHRQNGRFGFNRNPREGYFDNLALADRCLGELRRAMEAKGTWDSSLVIVSSDHHWRTNTFDGYLDKQHVPYLAKFPHQRQTLPYDGRFNTLLTRDLILQVLDGKIRTPAEAAGWLDRSARQGLKPVVISVEQPDAD